MVLYKFVRFSFFLPVTEGTSFIESSGYRCSYYFILSIVLECGARSLNVSTCRINLKLIAMSSFVLCRFSLGSSDSIICGILYMGMG